jgi:predicted secreted protein
MAHRGLSHRFEKWPLLSSAVLIGLLGSLLYLGGAAASPPPQGPTEIRLGMEHNGSSLDLTEDEVLVVSLDSNPSTGYEWQLTDMDPAVLQKAAEVQFEPAVPGPLQLQANGRPVLGAPEKTVWRFRATGAAQTRLHLVYRRPWSSGAPPAQEFSLQVNGIGSFTKPKSLATPPPTPVPTPNQRIMSDAQAGLGLAAHFNWCEQGGCTPVRDQGGCGSCWAFSTVGVLESAVKIKNGLDKDLSEQYLVSCNTEGMSCAGGYFAHDYHWNRVPPGEPGAGARYESDFPYRAANVACNPPHTAHERLTTWDYISSYSGVPAVADIKQAIIDHGPVAAGVCVGSAFQAYRSGIFATNETCSGSVNHAIVLVGWDDTNGVWYLRNSWGAGWGEAGYMRIKWGFSKVGYDANYISYGASAPNAPSRLSAVAASQTQMNLSWSDNSTNESDFHIERSPNGSTGWTGVYTAAANSTGYSNTGLTCGTPYYYRVRAHRHSDNQYSAYSNTANATTQTCQTLNAPSRLVARAVSRSQISLSWVDNSTNESDFHVERSPNGSTGWTGVYTATANSTGYSNTGLACGTPYYYRVRAHRHSDNQYSAYSNTARAVTSWCWGSTVANDDIGGAISIAGQTFSMEQDTSGATTMNDDPYLPCVVTRAYRSVWFAYPAAYSGTVTVDTLGSDFDTALAVWSGEPGSLENIACNDNAGQILQSRVQVPALAGNTYYIEAVDLDPLGTGSLHITFWAQPADVNPLRFPVYIPVVLSK